MKHGVPTIAPAWISSADREPPAWGRIAAGAPATVAGAAIELLREPPVDDDGLAELADQHVAGLQIAMDDPPRMRVPQRLGQREDVRQQGQAILEGARLLDRLGQRAPGDQAHRVERRPVGPGAGLVDRHDRRVLQLRRDHRLALEPRAQVASEHLLRSRRRARAGGRGRA